MPCVVLVLLLLLTGCVALDGRDAATEMAQWSGFTRQRFVTSAFILYGQLRPGLGDTLHVYIEGDGVAWRSRTQPSADPTPRNPMGLRLACADPTPHPVLYLAGPVSMWTPRTTACAPANTGLRPGWLGT